MDIRVSRRKTLALILILHGLRRRRTWVHPRNVRRKELGTFQRFMAELQLNSQCHYEYFRMSAGQMDELLSLIGPELTKQSTNFRAAIDPKQRLAVGLRFMASGDSFVNLASIYGLGHATVSHSIHMVCLAIESKMKETYLPQPTEGAWKEIAHDFWKRWNFPNCLGAIGGKHIVIRAPPSTAYHIGPFKKVVPVIMLALVDAEHRFLSVEIMDNLDQANNDAFFATSDLGRGMENGTFHVPKGVPLPDAPHLGNLPFMMVANTAFPLKTYLMRPHPKIKSRSHDKKIFNYRLSRARALAENSFGILASRWRVFLRTIQLHPANANRLIVACCILHNFLLNRNESVRLLEDKEREKLSLPSVHNMGGNRGSNEASRVRDILTAYFNSPEGSVSWQDKMV